MAALEQRQRLALARVERLAAKLRQTRLDLDAAIAAADALDIRQRPIAEAASVSHRAVQLSLARSARRKGVTS